MYLIPFSLLLAYIGHANAAVQITVPATPSTSNVVHSNFLGISFELSFLDQYLHVFSGFISTRREQVVIPYAYVSAGIVRIVLPTMINRRLPWSSFNRAPSIQRSAGYINPLVWTVMAQVAKSVNGVAYVINVPLGIAPNASIANDMRNILGSSLDSMLLGNEPIFTRDMVNGLILKTILWTTTLGNTLLPLPR
ncbi:hypothetical protein B0H13DRAFT_86423 [Mycena leptocephala]|nr:hypothetical protein B0H13DRAFT_86423 [Mycena leptocephala]